MPETISMSGSDLVFESDSSNVTISAVDSTVKAVIDGADMFRFTASDDNVPIQNGDSNDVISLDFIFNDISSYTTFNFSDGTHTADFSNKTL